MSTTSFQELQYKQIPTDITEAVDKAILIIRDIFNTVPAALPFILEPSALLLFANFRAESPYHLIGEHLNDNQITMLDAVLAKHDIYRFVEKLPVESAYPVEEIFSLVNATALNAVVSKYECIKETWIPLNLEIPFRYAYIEWVFLIERSLAKLMDEGNLPSEWLKDWWAPHNLRFGMLLGYPGEAISSFLWTEAYERSSGNENGALKECVIAVDKQYFGAQVSFYINQAVIDNKSVIDIENTWKTVIDQIYDKIPFSKLMNDDGFANSFKQLKIRETGEE